MHVAHIFTILLGAIAFPFLAVATDIHTTPTVTATTTRTITITQTASSTPLSQCNTGAIQCCDSVQSASSTGVSSLLGLLGIVLENLNIPVGLNCSPLSIIGIGGNSCTAAPVCCENNTFSKFFKEYQGNQQYSP